MGASWSPQTPGQWGQEWSIKPLPGLVLCVSADQYHRVCGFTIGWSESRSYTGVNTMDLKQPRYYNVRFFSLLAPERTWTIMSLNIQRPAFLRTPYDDCTDFQSWSTELVVFSPSVGEYVTIAWYVVSWKSTHWREVSFYTRPTFHGRRIIANGIKTWLRNRGLHWSCFCSLTFGGSRSARIVEAVCGDVYAFCNNLNRSLGCGFRSGSCFCYSELRYVLIYFSQLDSNSFERHIRVRIRASSPSSYVPTSF